MRWLFPVLLIAAAGAGIWWVLKDDGPLDENPDARINARGGVGEGDGPDAGLRVDAPPRVGVIGRAAPSDYEGEPGAWREKYFEWPEGLTRVTGRELAAAVAKHVPVRFASNADMQAFFAHEFLDRAPEGKAHLMELREIVKRAGFMEEEKDNFVLLRRDPGDERPPK